MNTSVIFPCVALAVLLGCANHDHPEELPIVDQKFRNDTVTVDSTFMNPDTTLLKVDSTFQSCDSVFIATYPGTACCVSGLRVGKPGDIVRYHYQINFPDAHVLWKILEGDISIISGQDTQTVTVQFGSTFSKGVVYADGDGLHVFQNGSTRIRCTDRVVITDD